MPWATTTILSHWLRICQEECGLGNHWGGSWGANRDCWSTTVLIAGVESFPKGGSKGGSTTVCLLLFPDLLLRTQFRISPQDFSELLFLRANLPPKREVKWEEIKFPSLQFILALHPVTHCVPPPPPTLNSSRSELLPLQALGIYLVTWHKSLFLRS